MTGWDPYLDPDAGVLRNRLGITSASELARAEADLTALRLFELGHSRLPGTYNLSHLQDFHRYIFGDVYDWAGQLRTVSIGKGQLFCLPQHLDSFAAELFANLHQHDLLRGRVHHEFVVGLADLLGDVNALHPFRDGNGRTQRAFLSQLARDAGYDLRWTAMDPVENDHASRLSLAGDTSALRAMLVRLVQSYPHPPPQRSATSNS